MIMRGGVGGTCCVHGTDVPWVEHAVSTEQMISACNISVSEQNLWIQLGK